MNPNRITLDEFEQICHDAMAALPAWVRRAVEEVAVLVEDVPDGEAPPVEGLLLGLYRGVPFARRGFRPPGSLPDTITLYRIPIVAVSGSPAEVQERVGQVLMHEIGHAMGLTEDRLRELGVG